MRKWMALWVASLIAVAAFTSAAMLAQTRLSEQFYRVVSGSDVGFRIEGTDAAGKPVGRWMVRFKGEWVELGTQPITRRLN